jgi:hypothetical protein
MTIDGAKLVITRHLDITGSCGQSGANAQVKIRSISARQVT